VAEPMGGAGKGDRSNSVGVFWRSEIADD
jgi:hypothetical protein